MVTIQKKDALIREDLCSSVAGYMSHNDKLKHGGQRGLHRDNQL
jgi:hypothetical protein